MSRTVLLLPFIAAIFLISAHSASLPNHQWIAITKTPVVKRETVQNEPSSTTKPEVPPKITNMQVNSNVSNRFAQTVISSKFANPSEYSQEATFSVVLPETAYISGFVMEVGNKSYHAYVREKEQAKQEYQQAVASGISAGHVAVSARDSNRFTVSVNVEPLSKVTFNLSYDQLLLRKDGLYDLVINLHPGQPIKDLQVEVKIDESRPLLNLKAPPLRSGNEITGDDNEARDPRAEITNINPKSAVVKFNPTVERQKELAKSLGTKEDDGLAGQFVVQYDVERDPHGGEVLLNDGYFVHFFAPSELEPLNKHVVFVLDISGSMWDRKMEQLKQAMNEILSDLHAGDLFNLVQFESIVQTWDLEAPEKSPIFPVSTDHWYIGEHNQSVKDVNFPRAYNVNEHNIKKAKDIVGNLSATGGTNIFDALTVALRLVEVEETKNTMQPIIMFLTDGDPTVGVTSTKKIVQGITGLNDRPKPAAIFTLSFGEGADTKFLKELALGNQGFSRHIYEAADATLQLQDFYRQISSPLLSKVHFKYAPSVVQNTLTKTDFPILFKGRELIVAGRYDPTQENISPTASAWGIKGPIDLVPQRKHSISGLERLWSYLTIQQLMEERETSENKTDVEKKALDLALKYSFVTPVSSLVVVKPNATESIKTEAAKPVPQPAVGQQYYLSLPAPPPSLSQPLNTGFSSSSGSFQAPDMVAMMGPASTRFQSAYDTHYQTTSMNKVQGTALVEESLHEEIGITEFDSDSTPIMPTTTVVNSPNQLANIPWLQSIHNVTHDFITLPIGKTQYPLGSADGIDVSNHTECTLPQTANRTTTTKGSCTLIKQCSSIYPELISLKTYVDHYFCEIEGYAGVCCNTMVAP